MDFQPQIKYTFSTGVPLPFFMTYPGYAGAWNQECAADQSFYRDFEYLRQTYPAQVRKYQRRVEEILDKMDYEGSMIYDEYPDSLGLRSLGLSVAKALERESEQDLGEVGTGMLQALSQVLVCDEIYRRRQRKKKQY